MSTLVPLNWYGVVFAVAVVASWLLTFPARHLATEIGYVAQPDDRKVHQRITPQAGGVAMFVAMLVAWAVAASIPALAPLFRSTSEPLGLVLGAAAIFVVGIIDDLRDMSAPAKMAGQVLAATILYFLGVTWFQFKVPLAGLVLLSPQWTPLFTALWVIAITNAVNLIDGLDGLAAGVVAIASGALAVYGLHLQHLGNLPTDNMGPLVAVITCGICIGFLPHNFHPARIFMGDAGALLLGLLMAASTMLIGGRYRAGRRGVASHSGETYFFFAPLFIPFFILGVPIVDMAFAFVRRTANRTGFSTPDKNHLHHRLLRLGHGHRRSVLILWAWTALLVGLHPLPALHLGRERHHPLRGPGPRGHPLHPVPPFAAPGGRSRSRGGAPGRLARPPASSLRLPHLLVRPDGLIRSGRQAPPTTAWHAPECDPDCERCASVVLPRPGRRCDDSGRDLQAFRSRVRARSPLEAGEQAASRAADRY